ncbi:MAG: potassium transporter Kup [Proteobacteria bacterium]|nr:potassium transporter Kup [Pseudomonadota bacterium]
MSAAAPGADAQATSPRRGRSNTWVLALGSIGVVYGDIGTSPLYAVKESLTAAKGTAALTESMIFGVISLILWTLIVIVTLKYVIIMLRADNSGEGGTLSLMALAQRALGVRGGLVMFLGMLGAALFYGDAMITPAISVLSAVEGLDLVTPAFKPFVLAISLSILFALFMIQSRGTARIATWFGPIIVVWFAAIAAAGVMSIAARPEIILALNPYYGVRFLLSHGLAGLIALGAVFLAVTGAEALYADLGHFGRTPIRLAWLGLVFPSLVLNYLGQGALLLANPEALENPFFRLYPSWMLMPIIALATVATIIASQAVITGTYSMTQQAIQLGLLPRMDIRSTSETERGQIYIPSVNTKLMLVVLFLTAAFKSSSALAAAYGISVTGTMVVTVALATIVARHQWKWSWFHIALIMGPFFIVDSVFLGANLLKIVEGGWLPLAVGFMVLITMLTWRRGADLLAAKWQKEELPLAEYMPILERRSTDHVQGTAVFMTSHPDLVPTALMHNLKHNKILHKRNIIVCIDVVDTPRVEDESLRGKVKRLSDSFYVVRLKFGFMEEPDVPRALARRYLHLDIDPMQTSYFLSRRAIKPASRSAMPLWQNRLFVLLTGQASDPAEYFGIPSDRVIEIGTQVTV